MHHLSNGFTGDVVRYDAAVDEQDESRPAPGGLALVKDFVNSLDYPAGPDELATPAATTAWLERHGLAPGKVSDSDCEALRHLRERLRDVLEAHTGRSVSEQAASELAAALSSAPLRVTPAGDGWTLAATGEGRAALVGALSTAIVEATVAGTWPRLKVCASDTCRFAFYDHSKNGSGAWCSMRVCGCRAKARAYRQRRRETAR
jgi:predicted RNA-binding Zn ribbon-like protein